MDVPQGSFALQRPSTAPRSPLQAWDAADEYVLAHVADASSEAANWLIVNDSFGAIAVALATYGPQSWGDSVIAQRATELNLTANGFDSAIVRYVASTRDPDGPVDVALIKIPKTRSLLEDQLHRLRPLLRPGATIIGAGMTKSIHTSTIDAFAGTIGPTTTSLAKKKARLIFTHFDPSLEPGAKPAPVRYRAPWGNEVINLPNVFSQDKLDVGTRLLLEDLPETSGTIAVGDLGCGNGIVGAAIGRMNPAAQLLFVDVSFLALASAEANWQQLFGPDRAAQFSATDCLDGIATGSLDLIINNPPFHEGTAIGDDTAWRMFQAAKRALRRGGRLRIVGNRHLGYHAKLQRLFGNHVIVASNAKFVVVESTKSDL